MTAIPDLVADQIHREVLVLDGHLDVPPGYGEGELDPSLDGPTQVDLPKLERGGMNAAVFSVSIRTGARTPEAFVTARKDADGKLKSILDIAERYPTRAAIAKTPEDVRRIHGEGRVAIVLGLLNAYPFGTDLTGFEEYYEAGVRVLGFVHAGNNDFADSSRPSDVPREEHGGLAQVSKDAIPYLNKLGVLVDVSQLTTAGLFQTLELSSAPVIASHSSVRGIAEATRNLSDEELDAIKAVGGVVNVVAFGFYLTPRPATYHNDVKAIRKKFGLSEDFLDMEEGLHVLTRDQVLAYAGEVYGLLPTAGVPQLVDAIDYVVKRIGIEHVGIATDFNHGGGIEGYSNVSEAPNVTAELVRRGYKKDEIAALWGGNFLRVLGEAQARGKAIRGGN